MRGSQRKRRKGLPAGDAREVAIGLYGIHRRIENDPSSWTPFGIMQGCTGTRVRCLPGVSFGQGNRQDARGESVIRVGQPFGWGTLPLSSPSAPRKTGHLSCFAPRGTALQEHNGPLRSDHPPRAVGFARQEPSSRHRCPRRISRRGTRFIRARRYLSSEGEVKVKGRNPRPALGPLADQRFTRGVDVLTAYPRELRSLGPGIDVLLKETRKTTKTGTSPIKDICAPGENHNYMTVPCLHPAAPPHGTTTMGREGTFREKHPEKRIDRTRGRHTDVERRVLP